MELNRLNVAVGDTFYLVELKESKSLAIAWAENEAELKSTFDFEDLEVIKAGEVTNENVLYHNTLIQKFHDVISHVRSLYNVDEELIKEIAYKEIVQLINDLEHIVH